MSSAKRESSVMDTTTRVREMQAEQRMRNVLSIRFDDDLFNQVVDAGWRSRQSVSAYIREVLREHLAQKTSGSHTPAVVV
jgi:predicted HicB family RNase H-like nuclease